MLPTLTRTSALFVCSCLVTGTTASANSGTVLPLDQYQAGTEQTNSTTVPNGGFETVVGGQPVGWTFSGYEPFGATAPAGANTGNNGAYSLRGEDTEGGAYRRTIDVLPQTDYVVSAYMWVFPYDGIAGGLYGGALVWVYDDAPVTMRVTELFMISGERGAFVHKSFNTGAAERLTVYVGADPGAPSMPGPAPTIDAQLDNVSVTPLSEFVPPAAIPEPVHFTLLAVTTSLALLRPMADATGSRRPARRRRPAEVICG